jgi:hypothetical protein
MFYEQDILEGLTKKTFYDSSRIEFDRFRTRFIREDKQESRLISSFYTHVDTAIKCVTRPLIGPTGPGSSLSFHEVMALSRRA